MYLSQKKKKKFYNRLVFYTLSWIKKQQKEVEAITAGYWGQSRGQVGGDESLAEAIFSSLREMKLWTVPTFPLSSDPL